MLIWVVVVLLVIAVTRGLLSYESYQRKTAPPAPGTVGKLFTYSAYGGYTLRMCVGIRFLAVISFPRRMPFYA